MKLDAIIIADFDTESFSGSNPLRLSIEGKTADVQVVLRHLQQESLLSSEHFSNNSVSWASAPKLNGLFLFSFLSSKGFDVGLIDNYYAEREQFISLLAEKPRAVIISTTFISSRQHFSKLIKDIRSVAPEVFIIAGGSFVHSSYLISKRYQDPSLTSLLQDDYLFIDDECLDVDLYITDPKGYHFLPPALEELRQNGQCKAAFPSSARMVGARYSFSEPMAQHSDIKHHSIEWKLLPSSIFSSGVVPMEASSGCTSRCAFCNFIKEGRKNSVKNLEFLEAELEAVLERGTRYVWFVDDHFRLGKDIHQFCQRVLDRNMNFRWMSFIRADALRSLDFDLLRRSGCKQVQLGLESADERVLQNMNKKATPHMYAEVIRRLLEVGIDCSCYFIFGFPGETEDTIKRTVAFINSIDTKGLEGNMSWSIYPFILAPLSPIFHESLRTKYGLTGYMHNWEHRTMNAKAARNWIKWAFQNISNSGPVYRGDDLDLLEKLSPARRKEFILKRHNLTQVAAGKEIPAEAIREAFEPILKEIIV